MARIAASEIFCAGSSVDSALQAGSPRAVETVSPFSSTLQSVVDSDGEVNFSSHARERLERRGITLSGEELDRIRTGVNRAASAGARVSVLLMGPLAMVVGVRDRTVITVIRRDGLRENVFTQIDSAVFV